QDAGNPDILFNLAVSQDHLKEDQEALNYYQEAMRMMAVRGGGFDAQRVRQRIVILEQRL
ncbi:MAG: hypothetical protein HQL94_06745, partial [Magnetococcales bacterium]|nr:hypothetical protein [Magnetococcales bacterium]